MLRSLDINNIVVIDQLGLTFQAGLVTLTGETGAGKSIILDALGLILGRRAERDLVRAGADQARVVATFGPVGDDIRQALAARDFTLEPDEDLVIRRVVRAEGGGSVYVNDQAASVGLLKDLAPHLAEIHGQRATGELLDEAEQRRLLDLYGQCPTAAVATAWRALQNARGEVVRLTAEAEAAEARRQELQQTLQDIDALDPKPGEVASLSDERAMLSISNKLIAELNDVVAVLSDDMTLRLSQGLRSLARLSDTMGRDGGQVPTRLLEASDACERALLESEEATRTVNALADSLHHDPDRLQEVDDRLHEIKTLARKHHVEPDDLHALRERTAQALDDVGNIDRQIQQARDALAAAQATYDQAADALSVARRQAADRLGQEVMAALPDLKLDRAQFRIELTDTDPGPHGAEQVRFALKANPGQPFAPLSTAASGGEFARVVLALKVALAQTVDRVMVFDEVDQGVGGAVAEAVGRHLAALAKRSQVFVVTHSPQVASRAQQHIRIEKQSQDDQTQTTARTLSATERREEVARMLAGEVVTDAARQAADVLLVGHDDG